MVHPNNMGIYIYETKVFYYLEAGDNYIGNTLERVRKTLIQRGLIVPNLNTNYSQPSYKIVSCKEAEKEGYEFKPIFLSKHIKDIYLSKNTNSKGVFK